MHIGLSIPLPAYTIDPAFMAKTAEALGYASIWYAEHPVVPVESSSPFPSTGGEIPLTYSHFDEPYIALARASACVVCNHVWRRDCFWRSQPSVLPLFCETTDFKASAPPYK